MKWTCPVCGGELSGAWICPDCGFDRSRDYEQYATLTPTLPAGAVPAASLAADWRQEQEAQALEEQESKVPEKKANQMTSQKTEVKSDTSQRERVWTRAAVTALIIGMLTGGIWLAELGPDVYVLLPLLSAAVEAVLLFAFGYFITAALASAFQRKGVAFFVGAAVGAALVTAFLYVAFYTLGYYLSGYVHVYASDTAMETLQRVVGYALSDFVQFGVFDAVLAVAPAYAVGFHAGMTLTPQQKGNRFRCGMAAALAVLEWAAALLAGLLASNIWASYLLAAIVAVEAALFYALGYCIAAATALASRKKGTAFWTAITAEGAVVVLFLYEMHLFLIDSGIPYPLPWVAVTVAGLACGVGFRYGSAVSNPKSRRFCITVAAVLVVLAAVAAYVLISRL